MVTVGWLCLREDLGLRIICGTGETGCSSPMFSCSISGNISASTFFGEGVFFSLPVFADLSFPLLSNIMKLRLFFLAVYLYCHCTRTPFRFCGRAEPECCGYRACLHYLFPVCFFSACGQSRCCGGYNGMELYRGACF